MTNKTFHTLIASRTLALLDERRARLYSDQKAFYVWPREDRVVVVFDPTIIDTGRVNDDFAHRLSTRLQGRRVVRTNSRGLFLQVGYDIPPALAELTSRPLDLSAQPTAYHLPIGSTTSGSDLWVSLLEGDSFLVAGARGLGKTGLIHGMIQALLHGGQVEIYAFDGKDGIEFSRYLDHPLSAQFHLVTKLERTLADLRAIAHERRKTLLASGKPNSLRYNEAHPETPMRPIVLVVDEAALATDEQKAALVEIVERERATGFFPIIATNRPKAAALLMKSNLVTRICLPVLSWTDSQMVLGANGAEELPKTQGRGLIVYGSRMTEFQSYRVTYTEPTEETLRRVMQNNEMEAAEIPTVVDEVTRLADTIRDQWSASMSKSRVARLLGYPQYGGGYASKVDRVIQHLTSTTTTKSPLQSDFSPEMA